MERGQLRPGDGLCTGWDVWGADGAGTEDIAGVKDQPQQPHAGYEACAEKER